MNIPEFISLLNDIAADGNPKLPYKLADAISEVREKNSIYDLIIMLVEVDGYDTSNNITGSITRDPDGITYQEGGE